MILRKVRITKFQSIQDSTEFEIGDITCLVGKNEAGKTSILKALKRLNPIEKGDSQFSVTDDYPRSEVEDYRYEVENNKKDHDIVVKATFELTDEIDQINQDLGKNALVNSVLVLSKGYDNVLHIELNLNEKEVLHHLVNSHNILPELKSILLEQGDLVNAKVALMSAESTEEVKKLLATLQAIASKDLQEYVYNKYLELSVPKFLYFDEFYQLTGAENIETLRNRKAQNQLKPSDYPMLGLIESARLSLDDLINHQRTQSLLNKLEGASNHLSKQVLKYWSQNKHVKINFDVRPASPGDPEGMRTGNNIWAQIYDQKRWVSTNLGSRSRGFVWFFSFLSWYSNTSRENSNIILLLDEPGLSLHAKAQADLLRYFEEELKPHHQLIYTTHSPFMVDPANFSRVRIVQDKSIERDDVDPTEEGTKVLTEILEASEDSLFPLQGALGYDIYQTLFVGPNSLVVEGVSDLLYVQFISDILEKSGKEYLSDKWTITPVGGSDKIPTFVSLLGSQKGLNVATLIDVQKKDRQTIDNLHRKKLLKRNHVLTFGDFVGVEEADIEDMFDPTFYLQLVNEEYKSELKHHIKVSDLDPHIPRMVVKIQKYFDEKELAIKFNHYRPSRHLLEHSSKFSKAIDETTLGRFEAAFKRLNDLLSR